MARPGGCLSAVAASLLLAACGTTVPDIKEVWDKDLPGDGKDTPPISGAAQIEFEIKKHVYCELRDAVASANHYAFDIIDGRRVVNTNSFIPNDWVAQVSLLLQVDENTALNPLVSFNTPYSNAITNIVGAAFVSTPQTRSIGVGGTLSSTATRVDKYNPFWTIKYLLHPPSPENVCLPGKDPFERLGIKPASSSPLILEGSLGLKEWLIGAMFTNRMIPSSPGASGVSGLAGGAAGASGGQGSGGSAPKPDTVSIEIKFVIVSNGNIQPTWKLVRVSADTGTTPLLGVGRTRTHDLIVTIGPPAQAAQSQLTSEIGAAVSNATRPLLVSP